MLIPHIFAREFSDGVIQLRIKLLKLFVEVSDLLPVLIQLDLRDLLIKARSEVGDLLEVVQPSSDALIQGILARRPNIVVFVAELDRAVGGPIRRN